MKKVLLLLTVFCITISVGAQTKEQVLKALDRAKVATEHEKRSKSPTTWIKLADAYLDVYEAPKLGIMLGLSSVEVKLILREQKVLSSSLQEVDGQSYTVDTYDNKILYYSDNGQLEIIEVINPYLEEDMLEEIYTALMKAGELDPKDSENDEIFEKLLVLKEKYIDEAMAANKLGDIKTANKYFEASLKTVENKIVNQIDTLINYYVGLTFNMLKDYDNAKIYFQKCKDLEYYQNGDVMAHLAEILKLEGNPEGAKELLALGFSEFPTSQTILVSLINIFRDTNDDPSKILVYIRAGIANEPTNASLYAAEGDVHKRLGDLDEAIKSYYKSTEVDPTYYYGVYTVGSTYYDKAIEIQTQMSEMDINDLEGFDKLQIEFEKCLVMAIEPFEKAFEISADDVDFKLAVADGLKQIYFRFRDRSPEYKTGFEKYDQYLKDNAPAPVAPAPAQ